VAITWQWMTADEAAVDLHVVVGGAPDDDPADAQGDSCTVRPSVATSRRPSPTPGSAVAAVAAGAAAAGAGCGWGARRTRPTAAHALR